VATKRTTVVCKVKSCKALLVLLLVCIRSYLKSLLRYKFLIFGYMLSGHAVFTWARMWGSLVIFRSQKGVPEQTRLGNTAVEYAYNNMDCPSTDSTVVILCTICFDIENLSLWAHIVCGFYMILQGTLGPCSTTYHCYQQQLTISTYIHSAKLLIGANLLDIPLFFL
jgi:hypothetical protein